MKRIAKSVLKAGLIIFLFTGVSVVLSTKGVNTVSQANAATYNQVYEYLVSNGYTVLDLTQDSKYYWTAHTIKDGRNYITTIETTVTSIVGNTDVPS